MRTSLALSLVLLATLALTAPTWAQSVDEGLAEEEKNSALLYEFETDYDVVFKGVKEGLEEAGFEVNYASKRRNLIESSFKILATEDDFFDVMKLYGTIPYVASPKWETGRSKVSVTLEEVDINRIVIKVNAELSGFEGRFLNRWVYWPSNGKIEEQALDAIIASVEADSESTL